LKYFYNKFKFSSGIFYKGIEFATIDHSNGIFQVSVIPYFNYSGKYFIESVALKDSNRTMYLTMKSNEERADFDFMHSGNQYFISISHDGRKAMIFQSNMDGIILKG